mmetsp:Transcript_11637/g.22128  ORF Transcript_11637/g.22128 Transcript_11637/m.22128 type:complete len:228 (+) Transcript_11637:472-1155(+)
MLLRLQLQALHDFLELSLLHCELGLHVGLHLPLEGLGPGLKLSLYVGNLHFALSKLMCLRVCLRNGVASHCLSLFSIRSSGFKVLFGCSCLLLQRQKLSLVIGKQLHSTIHQPLREPQSQGCFHGMRLPDRVGCEPVSWASTFVLHGSCHCSFVLCCPVLQLNRMRCCHHSGTHVKKSLEHRTSQRSTLLRVCPSGGLVHQHHRPWPNVLYRGQHDAGRNEMGGISG